MAGNDLYEIEILVERVTADAVGFYAEEDQMRWLPFSQVVVEQTLVEGEKATLEVPLWLLESKDLEWLV